MSFVRLQPGDLGGIGAAADIWEAARRVDDPGAFPIRPELLGGDIAYGYDLEPDEHYLYAPAGSGRAVGVLQLGLPRRDNRHLATLDLRVHPDHRVHDQQDFDHRPVIMAEALRLIRAAGRTVVWFWAPEDDQASRCFLEGLDFVQAEQQARRHQDLAAVDWAAVDRLGTIASAAAADYDLLRLRPPLDEDLLAGLVEVTTAINDAPMGELVYEDEVFDLQRLHDHQTAGIGRGDRRYRVLARHRESGRIGGHTEVAVHPSQPELAHQADTAVARDHRGHRLGLLLKIDMMRWLAETEPRLQSVATYNDADNRFMIEVNEALGYRVSRMFATYQLQL